ncbi:MAG: putative lipid II flippase FtsW [Candidatus Eisenbacteria bacterium]
MTTEKPGGGFQPERCGPDRVLFTVVLLLVGIGVVMVSSASNFRAAEVYRDPNFFLKNHALRVLIALAGLWIAYRTDYRALTRHSRLLIGVAIALLVVVLIVGWDDEVRGARRWIRWGPISFQPSELAKLLIIVYLASFLSRRQRHLEVFRPLVPPVGVLGLVVGLIALEKNLSAVVHIAILSMLVLFVSGIRFAHLVKVAALFLVVAALSLAFCPHQLDRVLSKADGRDDVKASDYQVDQSLIALGSGGIMGVGIGQSKQKYFFLPDSHTDFVFGIVGEEGGILGTGAVMILFLLFGWRGTRIAARAPDREGRLLAAGITFLVVLYAMMNIAVATDVIPTTGVPLPFVSYGGSSIIVALFGTGVLLNISRQSYRRSFASAELARERLGKRSS